MDAAGVGFRVKPGMTDKNEETRKSVQKYAG
jgi:hypothetical protein